MASFSQFLNSFDPETKGKQFEVFVKWFLKNDPEWSTQVDQIWLWDEYPERWGPDCGIDLVFNHKNSEVWAVQYHPEFNPYWISGLMSMRKKILLDKSDFKATIPMEGKTNSLNVSAAVSAVTFERLRQISS